MKTLDNRFYIKFMQLEIGLLASICLFVQFNNQLDV